MTTALSAGVEPLADDEAYLLSSRAVLRVTGQDGAAVLQILLTNAVPKGPRSVAYAAMLDSNSCVTADMFVLADEGDLLIDCDKTHANTIMERFDAARTGVSAVITDETAAWRVFGQFNNQSVFDDGAPYIRFADPRRHEMGNRILRPSSARESVAWHHEGKWRGHAYRLGMIAEGNTFARISIGPLEANLHALNGIDANWVEARLLAPLQAKPPAIARRILPFRVEPSSAAIPAMVGEPILGGDLRIGTVIAAQKLFGLALIELEPWRTALSLGATLRCSGEAVTVKWPTWLAREGHGRLSPAAAGGTFFSYEMEQ